MGFGHFDSANLAVVGFAHVLADGTTPDCNSGISVAKSTTGVYTVTLPPEMGQLDAKTFFMITPINITPIIPNLHAPSNPTTRSITFVDLTPSVLDTEFELVILRMI